ncbi:MAG: penicillin-binding protein activator LpoB [Proteobacteria bacterium]|nr:penicillin-binding protein activator LpoB [Pseudomonadota bacterium]
MQKYRFSYFEKSIGYTIIFIIVIALCANIISCMNVTQKNTAKEKLIQNNPNTVEFPNEQEYQLSGNIYTNNTYNFQVTLPNTNWTIESKRETIGNGIQIAVLKRKGYAGFLSSVNISRNHQENLEKFAGAGRHRPDAAKYTYIAGKQAFFTSQLRDYGSYKMVLDMYKFVNNKKGYIFGVGYLPQWSGDELFMTEIDDLLNSFIFLSEGDKNAELQIVAYGKIGKGKLNNVAVLSMADLQSDDQNEKTNVLTNELQDALVKTGKFECLDRRNIEKVFQEHKLQQSGVVSGDTAIKFGNLIGAKYLVSSNLGQMGETSVIYIQITEVENGKILKTVSSRCRKCNDDMLFNTISNLVIKLIAFK